MSNTIHQLCLAPDGQTEVLQGNIAFAVGCVRGGIHSADGYPGTPSSEVIDRGLSSVQDLIQAGWSVNEAVASAVGFGHTLAGDDCVVTMKIPGLFQAADIFTSGAAFTQDRGALIYYIASDFTPSSTQHVIDPHYLFKSCFVPVIEPRSHQELHESAALAAEIARQYKTQVVIFPAGALCHSEGLIHLMPPRHAEQTPPPEDLHSYNVLPALTRKNYNIVMGERMPSLEDVVEHSPLNHWKKGSGKIGVITYGICDLYVREVQQATGADLDILSLGFSNPLPKNLIRAFCDSVSEVVVFEDGYRYLQETIEFMGYKVSGKEAYSPVTEWNPALIAEKLGYEIAQAQSHQAPVNRPPMICAGCPYRLFANEVALLKKKGQLKAIFGDIGCNTLLYYMDALDTGLAMGASEAERIGYTLSRPEMAGKCLSVVGDSTECHSGMAATRNAIYRNVPGVKVILDNSWTAMTGGQPSPTSPKNIDGKEMEFDLPASLQAHGARVVEVGAYDKKSLRRSLKTALAEAEKGVFTTLVVSDGVCLQKIPASAQRVAVDPDTCKKCSACLICPGLSLSPEGIPYANNLCSGCGGHTPACVQSCPHGVLHSIELPDFAMHTPSDLTAPPQEFNIPSIENQRLPASLSLSVRGVGGQGNLFFGRVLTQVALLAGYDQTNIIKGETHGMAQMGGPVISTFACGQVFSPVLRPGSADCLIAMEKSEVLRPGFLDLLKPGGTILLAETQIVPFGLPAEQYPNDDAIHAALSDYHVIFVDVLNQAMDLGDASGRCANVVMMGVLSTVHPFNEIPEELWLQALHQVSPRADTWALNYAAFNAGRATAQVLAHQEVF